MLIYKLLERFVTDNAHQLCCMLPLVIALIANVSGAVVLHADHDLLHNVATVQCVTLVPG